MNLMKLLEVVNGVLLLCIILCMVDACRILQRKNRGLWRPLAYYAVALGAVGCLVWGRAASVQGMSFQLLQDAGLAVLCVRHLLRELQKTRIETAWRGYAHRR